ncbi:uncharacterized protein A4U43_UnF2330 [Asparagus officinalis]|uniref:Integrase zinc-binding domain-containing protein n=1 Tax=Asparagus officinalis TaxID=4686 RepID=A0A1R3L7B6_ASPOF|nr:uncharacterized protein A4U43_UnF2330 [Asparagus officinalis]
MYKDLKRYFWWSGMRREIADYVAKCYTCQRVKAEHQRPAGTLQLLPISEWKWADISMDFIVGLPKTKKGNDSIWVIVDRLTKSAHFLLMRTTHMANIYQATMGMATYEALYGRPCRSPICWAKPEDSLLIGPELVRQTTEKVALSRECILTAQSRKKSYADQQRRPLEFQVRDLVMLKVSPMKGV